MSSKNQQLIATQLGVNIDLVEWADLEKEKTRRIEFIKKVVRDSGAKSLVLGISGGVDSLTAGCLCQQAVDELQDEDVDIKFIAVRLPYRVQGDEDDAEACIDYIHPDVVSYCNIGECVDGLMGNIPVYTENAEKKDFVKGNIKARARMMAQYALANYTNGLVVGTDHAAEAVMGFFTKFGDGACDLAPLSGLTKRQVRGIAAVMGAPEHLVAKTPTADLEELAPAKPDELAYGCTYDEIDDYLMGNEVSARTVQIIESAYVKTAHKRELPISPV
jgi:NAD+ synthase